MSECNCCCQYSTPPWWVTMGFVPPTNNPGQKPAVVQQPSPPAVVQNPGATANPGPGSVFGTNPFTGQQPSGGGGILGTVGNVVGDVLNPLGALTSLL